MEKYEKVIIPISKIADRKLEEIEVDSSAIDDKELLVIARVLYDILKGEKKENGKSN